MASVTIPGWKSFMYEEVWEITAMKDQCVFKTKRTGKYISSQDVRNGLLPEGYVSTSISTKMTVQDELTLELFEV